MKRIICSILGHRWHFLATFSLFGNGGEKHERVCSRCGRREQ